MKKKKDGMQAVVKEGKKKNRTERVAYLLLF